MKHEPWCHFGPPLNGRVCTCKPVSGETTIEELVDALEDRVAEYWQLPDHRDENFQDMRAARQSLIDAYKKLEREIKARGEVYSRMCERLQQCCQKYHLGLGGEHVDVLVVEEVARLRALVLTAEQARALIDWPRGELAEQQWALIKEAVAALRRIAGGEIEK